MSDEAAARARAEPLRVLDLFSGIGGFSLGLERTGGFRTIAFCEIDPFCRQVLAKHWPGVPIYEDVATLTADRLRADGIVPKVICGGFPCQDISAAGEQAGISAARSGLWFEYARLIGELRPDYVVVENVAALLHRGMDAVLGSLAALGYDAEWHCIPASYVGLPHVRDRVWVIANPSRERMGEGRVARCGTSPTFTMPAGSDAILDWREAYAGIRGMDDGIPGQIHRGHALGNAVVPQIPELIGNAILSAHASRARAAAP